MAKLDFVEWHVDAGETNDVEHDESTIRVHEVTKDTAGEYRVRGGSTAKVGEGSVLIETSRPDEYDVLPVDKLKDAGYSPRVTRRSAPAKTTPPKVEDNK